MKTPLLPVLLIVSIASVSHADMLRFSFDDPLGDNTSVPDLAGMDMTFDSSTGDFEILFTASAASPFNGDFVFNINLFNPDTGTTAQDPSFFTHITDPVLIQLSSPVRTLTFAGTNSRLTSWEAGDRVASSSSAFGPPAGPSEFRTRLYDYPFSGAVDILSNGSVYHTTIEPVAVPVPSAVILGLLGLSLAAKKIRG